MKPNREIPGNTHLSNFGMVVSVRGSVVDIVFEERLPPIHSLLHTGTENQIAIEVFSQLDAHRVRGIALTPTQGLARGMVVIDTGGLLQTPVGKGILSRMFDVFGNTIDRQAAPSDVQWRTVHRAPPPLARRSTKSELFETGIKVIVRGFKEEGTTSTPFDMVVMSDLDRFHLVADVIDRVPGVTNRAAHVKQAIRDKLLEHRQYIGEHGEDLPEIRNWKC